MKQHARGWRRGGMARWCEFSVEGSQSPFSAGNRDAISRYHSRSSWRRIRARVSRTKDLLEIAAKKLNSSVYDGAFLSARALFARRLTQPALIRIHRRRNHVVWISFANILNRLFSRQPLYCVRWVNITWPACYPIVTLPSLLLFAFHIVNKILPSFCSRFHRHFSFDVTKL